MTSDIYTWNDLKDLAWGWEILKIIQEKDHQQSSAPLVDPIPDLDGAPPTAPITSVGVVEATEAAVGVASAVVVVLAAEAVSVAPPNKNSPGAGRLGIDIASS